MKAFAYATCLLCLLLVAVILLSAIGERHIHALEAHLPAEDAPPAEAEAALCRFFTAVEGDRLLLGLLYSHERIDEVLSTAERAAAAARNCEGGEYALLLAELRALLRDLLRDLRPSLVDTL